VARAVVQQAIDSLRTFDELVRVTEARCKEGAVAEAEVVRVRLERGRLDTAVAEADLALRQAGIKLLDIRARRTSPPAPWSGPRAFRPPSWRTQRR
jgi:outer membrane protein TolC